MEGNQVPPELVTKIGEVFESILEEASDLLLLIIWFYFLVFFLDNIVKVKCSCCKCAQIGSCASSNWASSGILSNDGHSFTCFFFSWMQTDEIRQEFDEDMSILCAFSIVFERRPELRFNHINFHNCFVSAFIDSEKMIYLNWPLHTG
jgi:hypothetical protein